MYCRLLFVWHGTAKLGAHCGAEHAVNCRLDLSYWRAVKLRGEHLKALGVRGRSASVVQPARGVAMPPEVQAWEAEGAVEEAALLPMGGVGGGEGGGPGDGEDAGWDGAAGDEGQGGAAAGEDYLEEEEEENSSAFLEGLPRGAGGDVGV